MSTRSVELSAVALHIAKRRAAILAAWRKVVAADPQFSSGAALPRAQLHDHIPAMLEGFERRLVAHRARGSDKVEDEQKADAAAHGLHRWQQGFDLREVTRELGCLNECVVVELERYAAAVAGRPADRTVMADARMLWARTCSLAFSESTALYFRLQQLESAGHLSDLEQALQSVRELQAQHAQLWQQAAHDLRGNLGVVVSATAGLSLQQASDEARGTFVGLLDRNVRALHRLLEDVTTLARLQGGCEERVVEPMDAAQHLQEIGEGLLPLAGQRSLFLRLEGPTDCVVQGDAVKVRRIVQNLVLNAIKYTREGGVTLRWGLDESSGGAERWFVQVEDTGPGFHAGPGSQLVGVLEEATDRANQLEADAVSGDVTHASAVLPQADAPTDPRPVHQPAGEGLGLSIVKRLCELLDATIELESRIDKGTTFRILLPRRYDAR